MSDSTVAPVRRGPSVGDVKAGFFVFLIALPLCLGIAMASSFPPISGVLTAIVGGVVVTFLGSARLTIKGPAAGLIVIALGAVQELGQGDIVAGYHRALAVGVMAAVVQIVLGLTGAASAGIAMSPAVVHGMLAAIGVIIVSKQIHVVMGVVPEAKEPIELLAEIPNSLAHANPEILALGVISLAILFLLPQIRARWARAVPAPLVVLAAAVPLGLLFDLDHDHVYSLWSAQYRVGPDYLVQLPGSLVDAITFPDFSMALTPASLKYVVMFALVGSIESTLSVIAVDAMDPRKQPSNLNRDLAVAGIGNLLSAMIGGLPMISEIVRSKANVDAGAESSWANFFHGLFLLGFVALVPGLLQEIPLAALAAMLVYTGVRLASPYEVLHVKGIGLDQLLLFMVTLIVTLATDLLVGVGVGIALKVVLHLVRGASLSELFRSAIDLSREGDTLCVRLSGVAAFTNLLAVRRALSSVDGDVRRVVVDLSDVKLVDHTFLSRLAGMADEWPNAMLEFHGAESLAPTSPHPHASRRRVL